MFRSNWLHWRLSRAVNEVCVLRFQTVLHALTVDGIGAEKVRNEHFVHCAKTGKPSLTPQEIHLYSNLLKR